MRLETITLRNIRSYEKATIDFPDGVTLLSGDIGSGKTSILLGVEFALFGIIRGSFSGDSLLRHGSDTGSVTLTFLVDGSTVTVHRELKRRSKGVRQREGWYEVDGDREAATAREIKALVIDLLGYPESLVTKSKSMLYRYTVYTPQEEMKTILRESADDRLEKIRKVLRLDKYRRVKDNVSEYARDLGRRIKTEEHGLDDEESIREAIQEKEDDREDLVNRKEEAKNQKQAVKESVEDVEEELSKLEDDREELNKLERRQEAVQTKIETVEQNLEDARAAVNEKEDALNESLEEPEETELPSLEDISEEVQAVDDKIEAFREKRREFSGKVDVLASKIDDAQDVTERIKELDECPTCGQDVDKEHEKQVRDEQDEKIEKWEAARKKVLEKIEDISTRLDSLQETKAEYQEKKQTVKDARNKRKVYKEKKKRHDDIQSRVDTLREDIQGYEDDMSDLKDRLADVQDDIASYDDLGGRVEALRERQESLQEKRETLSSTIARLEEKEKRAKDRLEELQEDLEAVRDAKERVTRLRKTKTWLTEHFTNVLDLIERHVLLTVHQRFDESFRGFFNDLVEDDTVLVDVDTDFTPRVTQDGFDMDVEDLSGGEKTSVALAYRLAMNDVLNAYMDDIKTDDVLVLDEPTDGFSGEQLDRLRDILRSLQASQILIVSHEEKLEGVTENIISVEKTNNRSQIV